MRQGQGIVANAKTKFAKKTAQCNQEGNLGAMRR